MQQIVLAPAAERDIADILAWSHHEFGELARLRYEALIVRGILDIAEDPNRSGSLHRPEICNSVRTYHLRHSRNRVKSPQGKVGRPRHFLVYRLCEDRRIEIGRVLHDSMDLARHLIDED